jgi:hypothetical protein
MTDDPDTTKEELEAERAATDYSQMAEHTDAELSHTVDELPGEDDENV